MNRVKENLRIFVLLLIVGLTTVLLFSCSKGNSNDASTEPSATITADDSASSDVEDHDDYYYDYDYNEDHYQDEVVEEPIEDDVNYPIEDESVYEPVVDETPVSAPSYDDEATTLLPKEDEMPVYVGDTTDIIIEEPINEIVNDKAPQSGIKHSFIVNFNPYALSLRYQVVKEDTTLIPYGLNALAEYRLHFNPYIFASFGAGIEYYSGKLGYVNVPFLFKVGGTCPIIDKLNLDLYAIIGAELNNAYVDYLAFSTGAGFDFAYSFNDNMALLLGFEYRYSAGEDLTYADTNFNRFILPTISFAYTL